MSLTSLLLAFAPAIAARFRPVEELAHENKRLKDELAGVMSELEIINTRLETIERNAELERAGLWRNEALRLRHNDLLPMPAGGQHALPYAYAQMAQQASQQLQQQAMAQAQSAQNMQLQAYSQGLAGLQQANWPQDWPHCDCSPSRSRALGLVPGA